MKKVYIIFKECDDPYYGDNSEIYNNEDDARNRLKKLYNSKRFAELYESELIDNTGYHKSCF